MPTFTPLPVPYQTLVVLWNHYRFFTKVVKPFSNEYAWMLQVLSNLHGATMIYRRVLSPPACLILIVHVIPALLTPTTVYNRFLFFKLGVVVIIFKWEYFGHLHGIYQLVPLTCWLCADKPIEHKRM